MSNDLPNIGEPLEHIAMKAHLVRLLELTLPFRSAAISNAAPISCQVTGIEVSVQDLPHLIPATTEVLVYFENYGNVVKSTWSEFTAFFGAREPWQDYDVCVFPQVGSWCIAISHNERVAIVGRGSLPS